MLQKNAVLSQNAANFVKSTKDEMGCCGGTKLDCQYIATYTQANTVSALTIIEIIGGVATDVVVPLAIAGAATDAQVKAALYAALELKGYYEDDNVNWPGIVVTDLGTTLQIQITGNINVKSLTASGGTSTFDQDCKVESLCTFAETTFTSTAGAATLHVNGSVQALGTITPGTTTAADVKTAVEAALLAEGFTAVATVTTSGTGTSQIYLISVASLPFTTSMYIAGANLVKFYFDKSNCVQTYS